MPLPPVVESRTHRFSSFEAVDILALTYFGSEELYWHVLDYNGGRLPDMLEPGEVLSIPSRSLIRITRPGI